MAMMTGLWAHPSCCSKPINACHCAVACTIASSATSRKSPRHSLASRAPNAHDSHRQCLWPFQGCQWHLIEWKFGNNIAVLTTQQLKHYQKLAKQPGARCSHSTQQARRSI